MKEKQYNFTDNKEATGRYVCAACGAPLFGENSRFEAGCGFPSFWAHLQAGVEIVKLTTYGRKRLQLRCRQCGLHLCHLFPNKFTPTGVRYCVNCASIRADETSFLTTEFSNQFMASTNLPIDNFLQTLRDNRSSESNFSTLQKELDKAIAAAAQLGETNLHAELQEIKEKYIPEYENALSAGSTAWPAYEKFVTQFERVLIGAGKAA
ncbi:peptide-methionine (R)-S-oxide reductase [Flavisolibacter sp. BT320]|nr:peptide-methionine (R)-S-oxide reductase [Flavisolibacter longurius]